jgi:hypothetical protein
MIIWFTLIIPFLASIVIYAWFRKFAVWWEYLILPVFGIAFVFLAKLTVEASMASDDEYWGSYVTQVCYEEDWNEYIHQTCTSTYTDSDGNTHTETYDCSYVDYHPEEYYVKTNIDQQISIPEWKYKWYVKRFKNQQFKDMHRDYHTNDGDMYFTNWDKQMATLDPITVIKSYENKVAVSTSIFNFEPVDTSEIKNLFEYPEIKDHKVNSIMTQRVLPDYQQANIYLNKMNGILGSSKECRIWVLIFDNKSIDYYMHQENYWKGGNKNEFIVLLSLADSTVQWARVMSWTEVEEAKILVRNYVMKNKFDLMKICEYTVKIVQDKFKRKHFEDFDYLTVEPSTTAIIIVFILNILFTVGLVIFIVRNDINADDEDRRYLGREFRRWL